MKLTIQTLADQVFDVVKGRIMSGGLREGDALKQAELAAEMGVSRIPVRDALARLQSAGLVDGRPNYTYTVTHMAAETAVEVFKLRSLMEPNAAAHGAAVSDAKDHAEVFAACEDFLATPEGQPESLAASNRHFHVSLLRTCRRPLTISILVGLNILSERYLVRSCHREDWLSGARAGNAALLNAYLRRDGYKTGLIMTSIIRRDSEIACDQIVAEHQRK